MSGTDSAVARAAYAESGEHNPTFHIGVFEYPELECAVEHFSWIVGGQRLSRIDIDAPETIVVGPRSVGEAQLHHALAALLIPACVRLAFHG